MRAALWLGGIVVSLAVVIGTSRLWAENKEKKPATPRTRIAVVNLTYVISNYDKYQQFREECKEIVEPYEKRDAELRELARNLSIVPAKGEDRDEKSEREELKEKAKKINREIEVNNAKAKTAVGKRLETEANIIFKDVEEAVHDYAVAHELEMVLSHNDAMTKKELYSPENIKRKLNMGALMPMYLADGIDISKEIVVILNRNMRKD